MGFFLFPSLLSSPPFLSPYLPSFFLSSPKGPQIPSNPLCYRGSVLDHKVRTVVKRSTWFSALITRHQQPKPLWVLICNMGTACEVDLYCPVDDAWRRSCGFLWLCRCLEQNDCFEDCWGFLPRSCRNQVWEGVRCKVLVGWEAGSTWYIRALCGGPRSLHLPSLGSESMSVERRFY